MAIAVGEVSRQGTYHNQIYVPGREAYGEVGVFPPLTLRLLRSILGSEQLKPNVGHLGFNLSESTVDVTEEGAE